MGIPWNHRYRIKSYVHSSLWIVPLAVAIIEYVTSKVLHAMDARIDWAGLNLGLDGAKAMFSTVTTLSLSFLVFTFGSLLVAIQVASGQYTPRIIATALLRDNVIRWTVGLFVFTLLFAVQALNYMETTVPQLIGWITGMLGLICIVAFLFLIDYAAKLLRPVSLAYRIGESGLASIAEVYPELYDPAIPSPANALNTGTVARTVPHKGTSAIVLAVNTKALVDLADQRGGVIEFAPQVGDFVAVDEPLFFLHGAVAEISDTELRSFVAFGPERTMEQDPLFAFRVLVDIAIKALSPAINDPTTAVLAIDQLHRLLRRAGMRNLRTDLIANPEGIPRVILRTPDWRDFVNLGCCEIRMCGANNLQIARRTRAMLVNLRETLSANRHQILTKELDLLDRMIPQLYTFPEDQALAMIPDPQGLGGSTGITPRPD